jgi:hypothetical protein
MKCSSLKHSGSEIKILALDDTRVRISPMMRSPHRLLTGRAHKSLPGPARRREQHRARARRWSPRTVRTRWRGGCGLAGGQLRARSSCGAPVRRVGDIGQGGGWWGSPRTAIDGEAAQAASGGGVQRQRESSSDRW